MIGCPGCGSSSAVQIVADTVGPPDTGALQRQSRWAASCDSCSTAWVFSDE